VGKPEGKRLLRRTRVERNIILKCVLNEAEREVIDWINVARNRCKEWIMVNMVMYFLVA
jgi:3-dehydroquinate dehydratase